jgi:hypothetical protein
MKHCFFEAFVAGCQDGLMNVALALFVVLLMPLWLFECTAKKRMHSYAWST